MEAIASILGRQGTLHDGVYTVVIPRDDLYVTVEEMYVPTAAGIESRFNFYHCSCGKTSVIGEFVLVDYEADDVVSTLLEKQFTVASLGPFLLHEHPRLLSVHFKGEGKSAEDRLGAEGGVELHRQGARRADNEHDPDEIEAPKDEHVCNWADELNSRRLHNFAMPT